MGYLSPPPHEVCMYVCTSAQVLKPTSVHMYVCTYVCRLPRPLANDLGSRISTSCSTSCFASALACMAPYAGSFL